jgi:hypothetical protein
MSQPVFIYELRANKEHYNDISDFRNAWKGIAKKWTVQLESGKESGYEHWQGRVSLIKKARGTELMNLLKGAGHPIPEYLKPTVTNEHKKEAFYCLKEDTRIKGPWSDQDEEVYIPRQFKNINLYLWQQKVIDSGNEFNDRIVDCIIDKGGCNGKSTCARLCMLHHKGIKLPCHNDGIKLIQATCNMLMARKERKPSHVFVDMPRAMGKEKLGGLYTAIEEIKGGYVYDERNHFQEWWYDSPRVWVFTNQEPDVSYLSADRWRMWEIIGGDLVPYSSPRD